MKSITITPDDYKNYYLYHYYLDQRLVIKIMRLLGGPLFILVGLSFYSTEQYHAAIPLFFIAYGIYYMLRPFLEFLIKKPKEDENFSYQIENNCLIIQDGLSYTKLNLFDYPLKSNKRFFYLHDDNKNVVFFPKSKLDTETLERFEKKITELYH